MIIEYLKLFLFYILIIFYNKMELGLSHLENIIVYGRKDFLNVKSNYEPTPVQDLEKQFLEIDNIINRFHQNNKGVEINNWRASRSKLKKQTDKDSVWKNEITSNLNKLSPQNMEIITKKIDNLCNVEYKDNNIVLEYTIDNIFIKAAMQYVYCPYYVKLINSIINEDNQILIKEIITSKSDQYQIMMKYECKNDLTKDQKESYDEFCEKIKGKTFKAGYSQFMGELYKNKLIESDILEDCLVIFLDNIEEVIMEDVNSPYIEDNIICICNLIKTIYQEFSDLEFVLDRLTNISNTKGLIKRLKFKIMDINDMVGTK